jgi:CelD/BcsL family acetyltransferase involved in cellulose biosynthesis
MMLTTSRELERTARQWQALEAHARSPMLSFEWVGACARNLYADGQLRVLVTPREEDGPPRAIAPLALSGSGPGARLVLAGAATLYEPSDLLAADALGLHEIVTQLYRSGLPLELRRVGAASATVDVVRRVYRRGLVLVRASQPYPFLPLTPSWTAPESQLASQRRYDLRRAQRRAAELGPVRFELLAPRADEVDGLLRTALGVEARSWKARSGSALLLDAARAPFYRDYARAAARRGWLRLALLHVGERVAAMQLAVVWDDAFWLLKIGHDEEFARCSPGILLLCESIRHAAGRGLRSYEFLGVAEPWIQAWTPHVRECVNIRAYPPSVRGAGVLAWDAGRALRRRAERLLRRRAERP